MRHAALTQGQIRSQLCDRIDRIATELPHLSVARLAHEVDDMRRIAAQNGLAAVEDLARSLENALAGSSGGVIAMPFLEGMRDAAECGTLDAKASQTFLAAINQRLYG